MSTANQINTGFVETNGTQLYYETMGHGHPLVLLHGGYMDRRMWDEQFALFAQHYHVIRYDIRGFGKSPLPQVPYADWQDLSALLTFLGIEKSYLLGLSLGGAIALDFTLAHPERVDALILVGSSINGAPVLQLHTEVQIQARMLQDQPMLDAIQARDVSALRELVMNHPTLVPPATYPVARQKVRENLSEYSFVWLLEPAPRQALTPPAWERLHEITTPTCIIVGADDDFLLHRFADRLQQDIAGAQRITIPATHHMPNMEKPEEFDAAVLTFLNHILGQTLP
jgi:pimeloyl-ACP methyl ester carboxylesterase